MNLLSPSVIFQATGALSNLFDTNSRQIIVNKQPIEILSSGEMTTPTNLPYGYGTPSYSPQQVSYQPISGIYSGVILYNYHRRSVGQTISEETMSKLVEGENYIKVRSDASSFIENGGKVVSVIVDNKTWNLGSIRNVAYHWGMNFYYYNLVETN